MQEKKQEIYKIHCFYMGKIKKNDNLIIKDLMSSYKSRDLGSKLKSFLDEHLWFLTRFLPGGIVFF